MVSNLSHFFFFATTITLSFSYDANDIAYIISEAESDLTLEAGEYGVTLQVSGGNCEWYLEPTDYGRYAIVNKATGEVLDVQTETGDDFVITANFTDSSTQKWYFDSDGTIVNAGNNFAISVFNGTAFEESPLVTYEKNETNVQIFRLSSITHY